MKAIKYLALAVLVCLNLNGWAQQGLPTKGYAIDVQLKPFKNQQVFLAFHYGESKGLADSVMLDADSKGVFKGTKPLSPGIYMMVSPQKVILFELLIDKNQHFSILGDTAALTRVEYKNSPDNTDYQEYLAFVNERGDHLNKFQQSLTTAAEAEKPAIRQQMQVLSKEIDDYRAKYLAVNPTTILSSLFNALKEPVVPPAAEHPGGKYDSSFAYHYFKNHYWDGVAFNSDRLVRTPFFKSKLNKYYTQLVSPEPDSIIKEATYMLEEAISAGEMFKFLLSEFINKYINPEYMGQDKVFIHLFEKYINAGKADWLNEGQIKHINERAYSLMANQIGLPAPALDLTDTLGVKRPLSKIKAPFTIIYFWDPSCGHCKTITPLLDSMFQHKWKARGIALLGVLVDGGTPAWKTYIHEHGMKGWTHLYQTEEDREAVYKAGVPSYRQLYDVYQTPALYLLDAEKRIIAKKLSYDQLDKIIDMKMQETKK